jgi:hypothetical protein
MMLVICRSLTMGPTTPTRGHLVARGRARTLWIAAATCFAAWLVPAAGAGAFTEPVSGGTTTLALELPKKISATAVGPATANGNTIVLQNSGGVVDASRNTARLDLAGGLTLKARRGKADITGVKLNIGPTGIINALVKGEQLPLAEVAGSQIQAGSLEASLAGAPALLTADGAKKLNRALGKKKKKGKAGAQASKKKKFKKIFRENDRLGTVSTDATLSTLPVRSQGNAVLAPDSGSVPKFLGKGVFPLPGAGGIDPVPPAQVVNIDQFQFPVTGGRVAPDLSLGHLVTAGGLRITKTMNNNSACTAQKPIGTFIEQTNLTIDFQRKQLLSTINSTGGFVGADVITADLAFGSASASVSPSGQLTIQDLGVFLLPSSATTLNGIFGTQAQGCGADFQAGDKLGELNVNAQLG